MYVRMCVCSTCSLPLLDPVNYPPRPAPLYVLLYPAGITGSFPAGGMDVCLFWVVMSRTILLADRSFRGILPSVLCSSVIVKPR